MITISRKSQGIAAERELLHKFWNTGRFIAMRAPGSGAIKYPVPDLLVGNHLRRFAIECKTTKSQRQYLRSEQINDLKTFSDTFGAEPWVAVRFPDKNWYFLSLEDLDKTAGNNFVISLESAKRKGLFFEEIINSDPLSSS